MSTRRSHRTGSRLVAFVAVLGLLLMGTTALSAVAAGADTAGDPSDPPPPVVQPILISGNPDCADLNADASYPGVTSDYGFKLSPEGAPVNGNYPLTSSYGTLTGSFPGDASNSVTISNSLNGFFDWAATLGIDAVIVKGGNNADAFVYVPEGTADAGLHAPFKDDGITNRDISHVEFCFDADQRPPDASPPTVIKGAAGSYDNTYTWNIEKAVDKTSVSTADPTAMFTYKVSVSHDAGVVGNVKVNGAITVTNPNGASVEADVTDELSDGTACAVTGGTDATLQPGNNNTFNYSCSLNGSPSGDLYNKATVTWGEQTLTGGARLAPGAADFTTPKISFAGTDIDECVDVVDNMNGQAEVQLGDDVCVGGANPTTFPDYSRTVDVPRNACASYENTATSSTNDTGTEDTASKTVSVCGPVTGGLTIGFWQNKNGQDLLKSPKYGVCPSADDISAYNPFKDLSPTATCAQVASYVSNVIKLANASGASMNAMLKAQMLATALDVIYGKVGGAVYVDLTKIPHPVTSTSNYPPTTDAWGSDTCQSVNELLTYASNQYLSATSWYGQVKATQEQAKDTFDAINNEKAFACVNT